MRLRACATFAAIWAACTAGLLFKPRALAPLRVHCDASCGASVELTSAALSHDEIASTHVHATIPRRVFEDMFGNLHPLTGTHHLVDGAWNGFRIQVWGEHCGGEKIAELGRLR